MSSPAFIPSFATWWMKILLSRSKSRISQLTKELIKETTAFANIGSNSLDLYHVKIPDANKVDLMARVKALTPNPPPLPSKSLTSLFPTSPKAKTVHVFVKPSKLYEYHLGDVFQFTGFKPLG
jgi:hypothetical protein